ncbi:MAG: SPASM domain-containing protein [Elusimicrobiales bacterium]|nr:SPASM domain-containing protein [Elusimicrobiales bacterium]
MNNKLSLKFKESFYNIKERMEGYLLIYNTKTGAFIAVEEKYISKIDSIFQNPDFYVDDNDFRTLKENGFIVESFIDELEDVKNTYFTGKHDTNSLDLTMLASENCNFRCPYCFIYEQRGFNMKDGVYESVHKLIDKKLSKDGFLRINWFGGEPTLAKDKIINFMILLKEKSKKIGFSFKSSIITNGYLLDFNSFLEYLNSGISDFQITVDGWEETHNKTRVLKNGEGTFNVIWNNLVNIRRNSKNLNFSLTIRCNFLDNANDSINKLIKNFLEEFGNDKRFNIVFKPVYYFETKTNEVEKISAEVLELKEGQLKQIEYGLSLKNFCEYSQYLFGILPAPISFWCLAEKNNSFIINADGSVGKCDTYTGNPDKVCGKITVDGDMVLNNKKFEWDFNVYETEEYLYKCSKCKYLPICQGGCARGRKNRIKNDNCYYNKDIIKTAMIKYHKFMMENKTSLM